MTSDRTNGAAPASSAADMIRGLGKEQAQKVRDLAEEVLALGQSYHRTLQAVADDMEAHSQQTAEVVAGTLDHMSALVAEARAKRAEYDERMNALASRFHRMPDRTHQDALVAVEQAISDAKAA
jgi:hypothetical protein